MQFSNMVLTDVSGQPNGPILRVQEEWGRIAWSLRPALV